jgi:hypothetical protein
MYCEEGFKSISTAVSKQKRLVYQRGMLCNCLLYCPINLWGVSRSNRVGPRQKICGQQSRLSAIAFEMLVSLSLVTKKSHIWKIFARILSRLNSQF